MNNNIRSNFHFHQRSHITIKYRHRARIFCSFLTHVTGISIVILTPVERKKKLLSSLTEVVLNCKGQNKLILSIYS